MNKMIFEQVGHNEWCYKESKSLHNILSALSAAEALKELLRSTHKPPKVLHEGFITLGGDDEAYLYWKNYGKFWNETPAALNLLKKLSK